MARYFAWVLTLAFLGSPAFAEPAAHQQGASRVGARDQQQGRDGRQPDRPWKRWWQDPQDRAELGITDEQSARIEQIFQEALQQQRPRYVEFRKLETELNKVIKDGSADAALVQKQVERVENLRAEVAKTRTMMIYRMHQVLSAEQRAKLQARFDRDRRKTTELTPRHR